MATAYLLPVEDGTLIIDVPIVLDNTSTLNLSSDVEIVTETTETIGGQEVDLTQEVKFNSNIAGEPIFLRNSDLTSVLVQIDDKTKVSGPATWTGEITPPKEITTSGFVAAGFQTPKTSIQVGSPDVILVFDEAVTILLTGTTGQTAYKIPGADTWILISGCTGTYADPDDPPANGECSISNGVDTKILTFHFTEFAELSTIPTSTPSTTTSTTSSSGGGGRTGVGSSGGSGTSSSAGFAGRLLPEGETPQTRIFPNWFQTSLVSFWVNDLITDNEFKNAMNYLLNENIIKIDVVEEKEVPLLDLAPSIKSLFELWTSEQLTDSAIIKVVTYYRTVGVW